MDDIKQRLANRKPTDLLDPRNDYVFKRLFADEPELLIELINAIRYRETPITELQIIDPTVRPESIEQKTIMLDILATDAANRVFNIEMQVNRLNSWPYRTALYLARLLSNQLEKGDNYPSLNPVIGIFLLAHDFFRTQAPKDKALWHFSMRDPEVPELELHPLQQLYVLEMPKAEKLGNFPPSLTYWLEFIEHYNDSARMNNIDYQPVQKAMNKLRNISQIDADWVAAFQREKYLFDQKSQETEGEYRVAQAKAEGREEGIEIGTEKGIEIGKNQGKAEGIEIGKNQGKAEGLRSMLIMQASAKFGGLTEAQVQSINQASLATLERWTLRIMTAKSFDELDS